jgi:pyruvate formate lyase activating enzyme
MNKNEMAPTSAPGATIFDIQRFSLHDGPGIRTTIFFKGCALACSWCQNPESHKPSPELIFYKDSCIGCFQCREVCPDDAILDHPLNRIDYSKCNVCGKCVSACNTDSLRMVGKEWSADELLTEILKDKDYFEESGGGITLSGGEPLLHSTFLKTFLPLVKEKGIHINLETSGMAAWNRMEETIPFLDLIAYDIKHMDSEIHKKQTGCENDMILDNFARLAERFSNLQPRMPVIPGINDTPGNIRSLAAFLKENNNDSIHLLAYHNMGEAKLERINTRQKPLNLKSMKADDLMNVKGLFEKEKIHVVIYD